MDETKIEKVYKWIVPSVKNRALHEGCLRYYVAEIQANMKPVGIKTVKKYVLEFLYDVLGLGCGLPKGKMVYDYDKIDLTKPRQISYSTIFNECKAYGMKSISDIIWIRFTKSGHVAVVAASNDISYYENDNKTNEKMPSRKIISHLMAMNRDNYGWSDRILIFPLCNIPEGLMRSDIEAGVGNYLISKNVPILDYYSHIF